MLEFDDIQHILLTRAPALTGRYEFLAFRAPVGGRAWLAAILEKVRSAKTMRESVGTDKLYEVKSDAQTSVFLVTVKPPLTRR